MLEAHFQPLLDGLAGTRQTLALNRKHVRDGLTDPAQKARRCCLAILQAAGAKGGDRRAEARALFNWIRDHVTYRRDPTNVQLAVAPEVVLAQLETQGWSAGNCNTHATLMATLGHSVQLPIVWVLVGPEQDAYSHIYAAMELGEPGSKDEADLLALDTATSDPQFGVHSLEVSRWVVPALQGL